MRFKGTRDIRAQKNIPFFPSSLLSSLSNQSQLLVQRFEPRHQFKHGLVRVERTSCVYVWVCVCGRKGREEGIFTDSSIYIGFSTHLRVVYNVLCSIKTRTQQRACNKKEGEERTIEREGKGNYIERNENREIKKKEKRKERRSETERYRLLGKGIEEKIPLEGKYIRDKRERKMLVC